MARREITVREERHEQLDVERFARAILALALLNLPGLSEKKADALPDSVPDQEAA